MTIDMQQIKKRLLTKRSELQEHIDNLTEAYPKPVDPIELSEGPQDFEEIAVDFLEMNQEQSILVTEQALLVQVGHALKSIEDGSYGICVDCKQPIPERRLEALPWADRCIQDEERLERANLSRENL